MVYVSEEGDYVLVRLDTSTDTVKRSLPPTSTSCSAVPAGLTEEPLPYQAQGSVRILTTAALFRYYNQSNVEVPLSCPPSSTIRRVDIAFIAQTGSGSFDEGQAKEQVMSSVAIRVP